MKLFSKDGQHSIVVDPFGGQVLSWQYKDEHIFFPQQTVAVKLGDSVEYKTRGGMFICFPHFGPEITSGHFRMPQHGLMREIDFTPTAYTKHSLALWNNLKLNVLYDYVVHVKLFYEMFSNGFQIKVLIENKDETAVPINLAFHPYFTVTDDWKRTRFTRLEAGIGIDLEKEYPDEKYTGLKRDIFLSASGSCHPASSNLIIVKNLRQQNIHILTNGFHDEIIANRIGHYENYLLWSDNPEKYLCLEPYLDKSGNFGKPNGLWLPPKKEIELSCDFQLTER